MARNENPPVARGKTYFDGATISAQDVTDTNYLLGKEWVFEDVDYSVSGAKVLRSGRQVTCRLVRNVSGGALLPKRVVAYDTSAGLRFGDSVDGYTTTTAEDYAGVVDEFLPAAGVPDDDIFWIVVEGPTLCLTDIEAAAGNVISVGDRLTALTAVTSGATTAGRVKVQGALSAATSGVVDFTALFDEARNVIGRALSAKTTSNTDSSILVDVTRFDRPGL